MPGFLPYWIAIFATALVWLFLFKSFKNLRKEMIVTGLFVSPLAVVDYLTVPTYWNPETFGHIPVGFEAFVFTFFLSGTAAVIYEAVFRKKVSHNANPNLTKAIVFLPGIVLAGAATLLLTLNIIYFIILSLVISSVIIWLLRKDLHRNIIVSSIVFGLIYGIVFTLWLLIAPAAASWWNLPNLSGILLGRIPLEEFLFSLSFGAFVGPVYEFLTGQKNKN